MCLMVLALVLVLSTASSRGAVLTLTTVKVAAPGNQSVAIVPFTDAIYQSCADAPQSSKNCLMVGGVKYPYAIGQLGVTIKQWVTFLKVAEPTGRDPHQLCGASESSSAWPKYGQINFRASARNGAHYSVASSASADKPYGFANFLRSARFDNALYNGRVLSKRASRNGSFHYVIGGVDGHDRAVPGRQHQGTCLATTARRYRQRRRLPTLAVGRWPATTGQRALHRHLSVARHPHRSG
jgi:hypothetical protein